MPQSQNANVLVAFSIDVFFLKQKPTFTFWDMSLNEKSVINANNLILLTNSNLHSNYDCLCEKRNNQCT